FKLIATRPDAGFVVAFSRDSKNLLISSVTGTPVWWNLEGNSATPIPGRNTTGAKSADLSPDGHLAVLGRDDGTIQLLEIASGRDIAVWQSHQDSVRSVKFSPRGDKIVSGGQDRSIKVWDVATQKILGTNSPGEHRGAICSLA